MSSLLLLILGYLFFGVILIAIIGFTASAFWLPVAFVLVLLKVPSERQALGVGVLIGPLAFALLSSLAASMSTGYGLGVTAAMGAATGVASFTVAHLLEPHDGRPRLALFAPIVNWWREIKTESDRSARAAAVSSAADAAPTISGRHHHVHARRWSVYVHGGSFEDKGYFKSEAEALAFVKRWKKKGARHAQATGTTGRSTRA